MSEVKLDQVFFDDFTGERPTVHQRRRNAKVRRNERRLRRTVPVDNELVPKPQGYKSLRRNVKWNKELGRWVVR